MKVYVRSSERDGFRSEDITLLYISCVILNFYYSDVKRMKIT